MNNSKNPNKKTKSIVFHGRGGQGAKTAAMLLAVNAINLGHYAQAFPEYGPERSGAPVRAYVRISNKKLRTHQPVQKPNIIIVIDSTLLNFITLTKDFNNVEAIVINTTESKEKIKQKLNLPKEFKGKIATLDASAIAINHLGMNKSNVPTLAAAIKITNLIHFPDFVKESKKWLKQKLGIEKAEQNLAAIEDAYKEVKVI
jgi:pyruvate ferredoxin oxidoreductase gamma subunit